MDSTIRSIRNLIRKSGFDVVKYRPGQMGRDPFDDMARFLRTDHPTIFDVGANEGQSIGRFRSRFPGCLIHSFEPSPTTFARLRERAPRDHRVHLWNCALGSASGTMPFLENSHSDMSSFLRPGALAWGKVASETPVEVRTVDEFCQEQGIRRIDVLKSDTQGFDFEVFRGAEQTFRANRVGLIYFEVIFSEMYEGIPRFSRVFDLLTDHGFRLVSFYSFSYQQQLASWTDALFVHDSYRQPGA